MSRDDHRAPGRLAPSLPDWDWDTLSRSPSGRGFDYRDRPTSEHDMYETRTEPHDDIVDGVFNDAAAHSWSNGEDAQPVDSEPEAVRPSIPYWRSRPEPEDTGELPRHERHQLLMRTIQLYDEDWKLAGIKANQEKNRLYAYLVPRNSRLELQEAIRRNRVLIIIIDRRGNTEVKEPKRRGPWRKLTAWLLGD